MGMSRGEPIRRAMGAAAGHAKAAVIASCLSVTCAVAAGCAWKDDAPSAASGSAALSSPSSCIDEAANGRTLAVELNRTFEVCLRENPTTGYRWSFAADGAPFVVLIDDSFQSDGDRPGAGGIHRWRFRAAEPGSAKIVLSYRRPWEQGVSLERSFALSVRIKVH